ncbi:long-chain-fatty-acid--CoA ligase 1-like [Watersipora subatra]|uniref:long-chain-fatty-acid--CoA ligase 1-like n=1 Tax=Watersipora subatra TaxID=2589382 RepID=UPI00355C5C95
MDSLLSKPAATATLAGLASYAAYTWATSDPEGYRFDPSFLAQQSIEVPDIPACRRSKYVPPDSMDASKSLYDMFDEAVKKFGSRKCFGWRSSVETGFDNWLTFSEVMARVTDIGYGLRWLGLAPSQESLVGMFSKNRAEMVMTQFACYQHSMVMVPMYDTLGDEGIEHIVNQTKMQVVFCDGEDKVKHLVNWGKEKLPTISTVVYMNAITPETTAAVLEQDWKLFSFAEVEAAGEKNPVEMNICKPEDLCIICYTSGTTGKPKGAMIEHRGINLIVHCALSSFETQFSCGTDFFTEDETYLSYLPMAHAYEQAMLPGLLSRGFKIGFYSGDVKELLNDIKYLRPTMFASVPRLLNKIYDKVMSTLGSSAVKNWLFQTALNKKEEYYKRGIITKSTLWDKLVFKKIQDVLGGRVKGIITGAAPISPPVLRFLRLAFGAAVAEGYGQTESSAAMCFSLLGEYAVGEVGAPMACNHIKLMDVPEMNYYAAENIGEVCAKGENVFRGYLKDEGKTKEAIDDDGWLHSGDIGIWTERGALKIVDRKKNIFKLSQGEYIAPEKIENVYVSCPLVAQCYVHGDSLQTCVVGVVVPDADVLPSFARSELGINSGDMEELCANARVKEAIMKGMAKEAKEQKLKGFEQVKDIHLSAEAFSVDNDLLTPTFKLKRIQGLKKYRDVFDKLYQNM